MRVALSVKFLSLPNLCLINPKKVVSMFDGDFLW